MKTYQSCGKFDFVSKTATAFTYLPDLNIGFRFTNLYNVSTATHYGIAGILINNGSNIDFSAFPPKLSALPGKINLKNLDFRFSKFGFEEITEHDEITFYCFHDDEFNNVNLGDYETIELTKIQERLSLFGARTTHEIGQVALGGIALEPINGDGQPKVGDGGILTANGSCIV